ncbi:hypothetical protein Salat_2199600 [Sesamum alatum]|uniref:DUF7950 domain-containing protein n=1 Tax=Sesamum alatum TaxID=300844 RepID=A0AAE1XUJ5_9LAMI|nr:hypothetical protein Salat_2199600 [Sesamum alatum]
MRGGCAVKSSDNTTTTYSVMQRIMLRFRPIAPKPAGGEAVPAAVEQDRRNCAAKNGRRTKRKYVRVRGRQSTKRKSGEGAGRSSPPGKSGVEDESSPEKRVVTLQLLPERSESDKSCDDSTGQKVEENRSIDRYKVDDEVTYEKLTGGGGGTAAVGSVRSVIKTWIIVECVTEIFIESGVGVGVGLGFSDGEKINKLQVDTCPGFVSDGTHNVVWVNEAYRKMVAEGEGEMWENGIMVWLVVKENLPHYSPSFACRVRMIQHTKHGHVWNRVVPCDVWRMQFAGFAWKLDVNTALALGI